MSLDEIKLPFLGIKKLPDKFRVAISNWSVEVTSFTKEGKKGQFVVHVILEDDSGQLPIKNSPPDHFLSLSNPARKSLRDKGHRHLDELKGKIVSFKKVVAEGFTEKTIEATKVDEW